MEDAFLRSVRTGREGEPPLGLLLDPLGVHFDPATPSLLEDLAAHHPLDDTALLDRARAVMRRLRQSQISKYNAFDPALAGPEPGYVLVVDQTWEDASLTASGATPATFREMLAVARIEHPAARIVIKTHPETQAGKRNGYYGPEHVADGVELWDAPVSPWALLEGATAVYTVSSHLGFEAILADHRPKVFGQPFYAGWGLTEDQTPVARRTRRLTRAQLAAVAYILAPVWYDPCRDALCEVEDALDHLDARVRAFRDDRHGAVATGMRLWKRGPLQRFYGKYTPLTFVDRPDAAVARARAQAKPLMVWASKNTASLERQTAESHVSLLRIEDGFLRSQGLGATLVPPLSLVRDDLGIYYDPHQESRLERAIIAAAELDDAELRRASRLVAQLVSGRLSKYNTGAQSLPEIPEGRRILVPGQVEDDASIRLGCTGDAKTNLALLQTARTANPDAVLIFKPHPDVEAGLRPGAVPSDITHNLADVVLSDIHAATALDVADQVWTLTSAMGFEALLRGIPVTCLGVPFYAGWGLTQDFADTPHRRRAARPSRLALAHAALISYPRYYDPFSRLPCPPEVVVDRLRAGVPVPRSPFNAALGKLQGAFASYAHLWR